MINLAVVAAYLAAMVGLGFYLARYVRGDEDFFLAGRRLNQWVIAGTVMATNVAAIYLVGPAGLAYQGAGFSPLLIAWTGNMLAAASALVFVPRFRRLRLTTITELLELRYGPTVRLLPTVWWIVFYSLFAGNAIYTLANSLGPVAAGLEPAAGLVISRDAIIVVVTGAVVLYCFFSGLVAVVYSDVIQAFLISIGGLILVPLALKAVGGVEGFTEKTDPAMFVFWKADWIKSILMWTILGLPYWCTSQYMLQRSLAGRSVRDASRGLALAALITGPITVAYIVPGICASILYTGPDALETGDLVLPTLFQRLLPVGLGGLFIAGLVAASNSTASSLLNSLATLGEHDVYRRLVPKRGPRHYTWAGRIVTLAGGGLALLFALNVERLGGIITANYKIMALFEPPVFVIVAAALFWRRAGRWGVAAVGLVWLVFNAITLDTEFLAMFGRGFAGWYHGLREAVGVGGWGLEEADRAIWGFPLFAAAMVAGSLVGDVVRGRTPAEREAAEKLFARMRGAVGGRTTPTAAAGFALAGACLVAFIVCAVAEDALPKPANLFVFMGLMMGFVLGCYLAIPAMVPEEEVPPEPADIDRSWVNRVLGSGWTWLAMLAAAAVLVAALYLV